jgi:hypothetical protein
MRLFDIARVAALISCGALLSACPKKDTDAAPEPAVPAAPAAAQTPINDKAGAEPPAPAAVPPATPSPAAPAAAAPKKKTDDDKGGW